MAGAAAGAACRAACCSRLHVGTVGHAAGCRTAQAPRLHAPQLCLVLFCGSPPCAACAPCRRRAHARRRRLGGRPVQGVPPPRSPLLPHPVAAQPAGPGGMNGVLCCAVLHCAVPCRAVLCAVQGSIWGRMCPPPHRCACVMPLRGLLAAGGHGGGTSGSRRLAVAAGQRAARRARRGGVAGAAAALAGARCGLAAAGGLSTWAGRAGWSPEPKQQRVHTRSTIPYPQRCTHLRCACAAPFTHAVHAALPAPPQARGAAAWTRRRRSGGAARRRSGTASRRWAGWLAGCGGGGGKGAGRTCPQLHTPAKGHTPSCCFTQWHSYLPLCLCICPVGG